MTEPTALPVRGLWLAASSLLGRPCRVDEPYPHICGQSVTCSRTGVVVRLWARDCGACAEAEQQRQAT